MKSLFEEVTLAEVHRRMAMLEEDLQPKWGRMTVGQMVWHCQIPLKIGIKNKPPKKKPNPFIRFFYKKSLYSDRPWRKNLPTARFAKAGESKDLSSELPRLMELITEFHGLKNRSAWNPHPIFGAFTHQQWGQFQYKHLDHHLRQFGV